MRMARAKRGQEVAASDPGQDKENGGERVGRGRRLQKGEKSWASLIPRSRTNSQERIEEVKERVVIEPVTKIKVGAVKQLNQVKNAKEKKQEEKKGKFVKKAPLRATEVTPKPTVQDTSKDTSKSKQKGAQKSTLKELPKTAPKTTPTLEPKTTQKEAPKTTSNEKVATTRASSRTPKSVANDSTTSQTSKKPENNNPEKGKKGCKTVVLEETTKEPEINKSGRGKKAVVVEESEDPNPVRKTRGVSKQKIAVKPSVEAKEDGKEKKKPTVVKVKSNAKKTKTVTLVNEENSSVNKIDSYFKKTPVVTKTIETNPRKRKSEDEDDATPTKKTLLDTTKKSLPKKSLAHRDILNLLDDFDDQKETEDDHEEAVEEDTEVSFNKNTSKSREQAGLDAYQNKLNNLVPVWKRNASANGSKLTSKPIVEDDVFNPDNYGEEEFGPDDPKAKPKKTRKKKKQTKAILVFGEQAKTAEAKQSVKESHNLKTPGQAKKTRKRVAAAPPPPLPAPPAANILAPRSSTGANVIREDFAAQPQVCCFS